VRETLHSYNVFSIWCCPRVRDIRMDFVEMVAVCALLIRTSKEKEELLDIGQLKCDDTRTETIFLLYANRTSPFKSAVGRQFSRLLAA